MLKYYREPFYIIRLQLGPTTWTKLKFNYYLFLNELINDKISWLFVQIYLITHWVSYRVS